MFTQDCLMTQFSEHIPVIKRYMTTNMPSKGGVILSFISCENSLEPFCPYVCHILPLLLKLIRCMLDLTLVHASNL